MHFLSGLNISFGVNLHSAWVAFKFAFNNLLYLYVDILRKILHTLHSKIVHTLCFE